MKIDEALQLIQADINDKDVDWDSPLGKAYKLSFEALKQLKELRSHGLKTAAPTLPGETE